MEISTLTAMQAPGKVDTHLRAGGETRPPGLARNELCSGWGVGRVDLLRKDPGI